MGWALRAPCAGMLLSHTWDPALSLAGIGMAEIGATTSNGWVTRKTLFKQRDIAHFESTNERKSIMAANNTVHLHRVLSAKPEKVYRAFLDPDALARWLPPDGFTAKVHHFEAKVGGKYKMSFTNFTTGATIAFGGEFREMVANERLRYTDVFDDPGLAGEIQVTVSLKAVPVGTELSVVQEGIPKVIPLDACYLGWQQSLKNLARLVEPDIPDQ